MSKTILHLDDEENIRQLMATVLTRQGYTVRSVGTSLEAIAAMREAVPDLIISDLQLRDADGLTTIAQLRELGPNVPVIMLTGVLIDRRVAEATLGTLVAAYLEKTRPLTEILAAITRLIGPGK